MKDQMTYNEVINYINNIPKFSKKDGLENTKRLMKHLGNPEKKLKVIHVAGTNGKGSVCAFLSSILVEAKFKVGLFTSPHLITYNERIMINHVHISDQDLVDTFLTVKEKCEQLTKENYPHPTFFEVIFAMAVLYFEKHSVDFAILETGMGGLLDATNVIPQPLVSVITTIGLDHTEILGDSIEKIAYNKAGIIKENCPVVFLNQNDESEKIINTIAQSKKSEMYPIDEIAYKILNISHKGIDFSLNTRYYRYSRVKISTIADYQIVNVAIVLTVIEVLKKYDIFISTDIILEGLINSKWPGRMDLVNNQMLLDGAHNLDGTLQFIKAIKTFYPKCNLILIFGCLVDKPYEEMIKQLCQQLEFDHIIITEPLTIRAVKSDQLLSIFQKYIASDHLYKICDLKQAINKARDLATTKSMICCLGSLYLIGNIYQLLKEEAIVD